MRAEEFISQPMNVTKEVKTDYLREQRKKGVSPLPDDFSELEMRIDEEREKLAGKLKGVENLSLIKLKAD